MKKSFYLSVCQATLLLSLIASCNKDDDQPNYHDDIVRCKVNGVEWEAFDYTEGDIGGWGPGAIDLQYYKDTGFFELGAGRKLEDQSINQSFTFFVPDSKIGSNAISFRTDAFHDALKNSGCKFYDLDSLADNRLILNNIDTVNYIITGQFEFSVTNECGHTLQITDGYFNSQYRF